MSGQIVADSKPKADRYKCENEDEIKMKYDTNRHLSFTVTIHDT
jgi:hypothetical protein